MQCQLLLPELMSEWQVRFPPDLIVSVLEYLIHGHFNYWAGPSQHYIHARNINYHSISLPRTTASGLVVWPAERLGWLRHCVSRWLWFPPVLLRYVLLLFPHMVYSCHEQSVLYSLSLLHSVVVLGLCFCGAHLPAGWKTASLLPNICRPNSYMPVWRAFVKHSCFHSSLVLALLQGFGFILWFIVFYCLLSLEPHVLWFDITVMIISFEPAIPAGPFDLKG